MSWGEREREMRGPGRKTEMALFFMRQVTPEEGGVEEGTEGSIWNMLSSRHQSSTVKHTADGPEQKRIH